MSVKKVDTILLGQGLAGSILAYQLLKRGQTVMVLDNQHCNSSSQVAAGIINPITGPRLSLNAEFDPLYTEAKQFYQNLEKDFDVSLWRDLTQQRLISDEQGDYYQNRDKDPAYQDYLGKETKSDFFKASSRVIEIKRSAIVDCKALITKTRDWLAGKDCLKTIIVNYDQIKSSEHGIEVAGIKAKQLIFCEGYQAINNPWLADLPFLLSKGEVLTVETNKKSSGLLNWGNWIVPVGDSFKLGSNYEWNCLDSSCTQRVKNELLDSLAANTSLKAKVTKHEAGIRPTTRQRRPFIGPLKNLQNAYCFNGFGSKGCLLIPHYAELLTSALLDDTELDQKLTQWL